MGKPGRLFTAGVAIAAALAAEHMVDEVQDGRPTYPEGVVCAVGLRPGDSPAALARDSVFRVTGEEVLRRSQFFNPSEVLDFMSGDEAHFAVGAVFNVMLRDGVHQRLDAEVIPVAADRSDLGCVFVPPSQAELVSTYPTLEAAAKILKSTVAIQEEKARLNEAAHRRRCGAIAIDRFTLLLPSQKSTGLGHVCDQLRSGESVTGAFQIVSDVDDGNWRYVKVDKPLEPVEIATNYAPQPGEVLVYSGYNKFGSRQYFRVVVEGAEESDLLVRAGVDIIPFHDDPVYRHLDGGLGGIFTIDGKLVALVNDTARFLEPLPHATRSYADDMYEYNRWLRKTLVYFGVDDSDTDYSSLARQRAQFVFGVRVDADSMSQAVID